MALAPKTSDDQPASFIRKGPVITVIGDVIAALAPKTSPIQRGALYEGHDFAAVGAAVDGVLLMTYEWGYTYGHIRLWQ